LQIAPRRKRGDFPRNLTILVIIAKIEKKEKESGRRQALGRRVALAIQRSRSRQTPAPAIRNRRGEEALRISATEAKNKLGEVLDNVIQSGMVLITRHETPKAVLLSMEEYGALSGETQTRLVALNDEFDAMLDRMQTDTARAGMKAAFAASPKQLGKAAISAARRRTRT